MKLYTIEDCSYIEDYFCSLKEHEPEDECWYGNVVMAAQEKREYEDAIFEAQKQIIKMMARQVQFNEWMDTSKPFPTAYEMLTQHHIGIQLYDEIAECRRQAEEEE